MTLPPFSYDRANDFHAVNTIQLCELIECGFFDWRENPSWQWDYYSKDQYYGLMEKIEARFYFREIGITPPGIWKHEFLRVMNELMPKYKLLYKQLEEGIDLMQVSDDYGKSRDVHSEYPATLLTGNADYASNGNDHEHEYIKQGDAIEKIADFSQKYKDVDVLILDELESLFSCMFTANVNGF